MQLNRAPFLGGFDVLESRVDRFEYTPHRHSEVVIAAYEGGFKRARCDRHAFDVERGDLLVVGPETLHSGATADGPGWHYVSVYLSTEQIAAATGLERTTVEDRIAGHRVFRRASTVTDLRLAIANELVLGEFLTRLCAAPEQDNGPPRQLSRGAEGLILGCTEIFLLIDQPDMPDFPMFNTAKLHCEAAIELALAD